MPRVEFDTFSEAKPWLDKFIRNSDKGFTGYFSKDSELILVPSRSTQPVIIGYVRKSSEKEVRDFGISTRIDIYKISRFEFNSERSLPTNEVIM